jgi:diguanylate cyclase (GGDEF)-like protein
MKFTLKKILTLMIVVVGIVFMSISHSSAQTGVVQVLILNSYHPTYGWADEVVKGIYDELHASDYLMDIHIEYMDTKRYPIEDIQEDLFSLYKKKYDPKQIDLIFITDDNALKFMFEYYEEFFQYAPIVFCGIGFPEEYDFSGYSNITGFQEDSEFLENFELIESIHPEVENFYLVAGTSPTAVGIVGSYWSNVENYSGQLRFHEITGLSIDETVEKIQQIPENSVIMVVPFARDNTGEFMNWDSFLNIVGEATDHPIYSAFSFQIGDHVLGGNVIDGYFHGKKAASRGLDILGGKSPLEFPVEKDGGHYIVFNYEEMQKHGLTRRDLPPGTRVVNEPETIWYRYTDEIFFIGLLVIGLVIFSIILLMNIRRRKEAEKRLRYLTSYDALTGLHNRHSYMEELQRLKSFGGMASFPVGILFIDMNGLKVVNDLFGHEKGDQYIMRVSQLLRESFNDNSFIARIGGDEFIVIRSNALKDTWSDQIEAFMVLITNEQIKHTEYAFGVAIGQVLCNSMRLLEQAVRDADQFMYQKKYTSKEHLKKNTLSI